MIVLELLIAISFAKYGGGLATGGQVNDDFAEKLVGWAFLLAGLALAAAIGNRL